MQKNERKVKIWKGLEIAAILLLCAVTVLFDFVQVPFIKYGFRRRMATKILQRLCGSGVAIWCVIRLKIRLFGKVEHWAYLLPCLLVAINNFQWSAFFGGKMHLLQKDAVDVLLFALCCLTTGLFEELVFRGILFCALAGAFKENKKGLLTAYVLSSVLFGLSHLLNGFSGSTLLQVGYSTLTGGLFAFCFLKTKNILCCALVHGVYNFCGLLYDTQGLGSGVVFDLGTVLSMLIVGVLVGIFVLYKVWKYPEEERIALYSRFK